MARDMKALKENLSIKKVFTRLVLAIFLTVSQISYGTITEQDRHSTEVEKLLKRLNLEFKGLENVKSNINKPELAIAELLAYYRKQNTVKHIINKDKKGDFLGKCASKNDLKIANDALKHIFTGQPAYPAQFCGDDINWETNPYPDKEWVWQLNRMNFWDALGLAYWHTGDEKYAQAWAFQLNDWVSKNPRDNAHQYAWRSIEAGIRGFKFTGHFQRFISSPSFTPDILTVFLNSCFDHANYLMTKYRKCSNWALMEAEGLSFIGIAFPEFTNSHQWIEEGTKRLNTEIHTQVYPDGHQRELSFEYHMGSIDWFLRTYELAKMNNLESLFSPSYTAVIEKMCEIPMKLAFGDGTTPQFGDSWAGKSGRYWDKLKYWAELFNRKDFLYVATQGREGEKPGETAFALKHSGLYSMRSGWDINDICLVLKCGPDGGGHSQPDNGTFELYAGGRNLMPDAGSFIYQGDPENRKWFRQTKVHQTITLNGLNSAYAPKNLLWQTGEDADILVVENQSYPNLAHRRSVFFVEKSYFVIVDDVFGEQAGMVDLHFQLAPGEAVFNQKKFMVRTDFKEGWNVMVKSMAQKGMTVEKEEGQVSFVYTKKEPRPAFCYKVKKEGAKGVRFVTMVFPYQKQVPKVSAHVMKKSEIGSSNIEIRVAGNKSYKKIGYTLKSN